MPKLETRFAFHMREFVLRHRRSFSADNAQQRVSAMGRASKRFGMFVTAILALLCSVQASAVGYYTSLSYDVGPDELIGYSETFSTGNDSWEFCAEWVTQVEMYGQVWQLPYPICGLWEAHFATYGVDGELSGPSGAYWNSVRNQYGGASVHMPIVAPESGIWTASGSHWQGDDVVYCSVSYGYEEGMVFPTGEYCYYAYGYNYLMAASQAATTVVKCTVANNVAVFDSAAVPKLLQWPASEPFERSVTMACLPDESTFTFQFIGESSSFGGYAPSNDPCKSNWVGLGTYGNAAAALHTHPKFTDPGQLVQGSGCRGLQTPPTTFDMIHINSQNADFSDLDYQVINCKPWAMYVRTPNGDKARRLRSYGGSCAFTNIQVHP